MKTITHPAVITPTIIGLALLAAAIVFIGVTGKKVPLLSNIRVDIILLVIIGMTICTQGGIGRIAASAGNFHTSRTTSRPCSPSAFSQVSKW